MTSKFVLVSHVLCPYVQRVAIVLAEKGIAYHRIDIDLKNKPAWFLAISPLAKTPVLLVGEQAIFESSVICEYLDETHLPKLHPKHALLRARQRAWMEFGSSILSTIAGFYNAVDAPALRGKSQELREKLKQLEALVQDGSYFSGLQFNMVDAVFAPVLRYFEVFETVFGIDFFADTPKVRAWWLHLAQRPSVKHAVGANYAELLLDFLKARPVMLVENYRECLV
ncbi:glutathione S-transferase family protein [Undibacterium sp. Ren11W]|uniref:glutathione S-transferase family protein n=1 Tax=Undibacterium sp. Ren11W TaxID=3413045 RepID=UPI003BF1AB57